MHCCDDLIRLLFQKKDALMYKVLFPKDVNRAFYQEGYENRG